MSRCNWCAHNISRISGICMNPRCIESHVFNCGICNNLTQVDNNLSSKYCDTCIKEYNNEKMMKDDNYLANRLANKDVKLVDENLPPINLSKEKSIKNEMTFTYNTVISETDLSIYIDVLLNDKIIGTIHKTEIEEILFIFSAASINLNIKYNRLETLKTTLEFKIKELFKYIGAWK